MLLCPNVGTCLHGRFKSLSSTPSDHDDCHNLRHAASLLHRMLNKHASNSIRSTSPLPAPQTMFLPASFSRWHVQCCTPNPRRRGHSIRLFGQTSCLTTLSRGKWRGEATRHRRHSDQASRLPGHTLDRHERAFCLARQRLEWHSCLDAPSNGMHKRFGFMNDIFHKTFCLANRSVLPNIRDQVLLFSNVSVNGLYSIKHPNDTKAQATPAWTNLQTT